MLNAQKMSPISQALQELRTCFLTDGPFPSVRVFSIPIELDHHFLLWHSGSKPSIGSWPRGGLLILEHPRAHFTGRDAGQVRFVSVGSWVELKCLEVS